MLLSWTFHNDNLSYSHSFLPFFIKKQPEGMVGIYQHQNQTCTYGSLHRLQRPNGQIEKQHIRCNPNSLKHLKTGSLEFPWRSFLICASLLFIILKMARIYEIYRAFQRRKYQGNYRKF